MSENETEDTSGDVGIPESNVEEATDEVALEEEGGAQGGGVSVKDVAKAIGEKVGDTSKSVWAMTKETLQKAEGKIKSSDIYADTEDEALSKIQEMIGENRFQEQVKQLKQKEEKKKAGKQRKSWFRGSKKDGEEVESTEEVTAEPNTEESKDDEHVELSNKWDFPWSPLAEFNVEIKDLLSAFCKWSREEVVDGDGEEASNLKFNISKAFRRLSSYANWMEKNCDKFSDPLTVESIAKPAQAFAMKLSHDGKDRLVWWLDVKKMNLKAISSKKITVFDSIRFAVWLTHFIMFDSKAQENGMLFIEDLMGIGFWKFWTTFPMEVGVQMDRLTIGVLPVKMKGAYVLNAGNLMKVLFAMMKPFMSKKMRQRMITIGPNQDHTVVVDELGGLEFIPVDCCGLAGTLEKDLLADLIPPAPEEENEDDAAGDGKDTGDQTVENAGLDNIEDENL